MPPGSRSHAARVLRAVWTAARVAFWDATWVFLGLSALTGIVWGLSEKDITFDALGMNASGFFVVFSFFVSIAIFAEICIGVFSWPTTGAYVTSLFFVGSFWWTGALVQPKNN